MVSIAFLLKLEKLDLEFSSFHIFDGCFYRPVIVDCFSVEVIVFGYLVHI